MKQLTFAVLVILTAISCKKEKPQYSATGYWTGYLYIAHAAILNRPDGSCRLYHSMNMGDTTKGGAKDEGHYTVANNVYRAEFYSDTILRGVIVANLTSASEMTGRMSIDVYNHEFSVRKE
jgi:hypothetical protein